MSRIDERFRYKTTPVANSDCMVIGNKYRFSVLTENLVRIEYSEDGCFEDRATQTIINRNFETPDFKVTENEDRLVIKTKFFVLTYLKGRTFSRNSLYIRYIADNSEMVYEWNWYYGSDPKDDYDVAPENLKGTARTLDFASGEIPLDDGILSRGNFAEIDDSKSAIIASDGWIEERKPCIDLYVFMYAKNYKKALDDFYKLTGKTPLIPRYALGNMWSRFYKYSQDEYLKLMDRFCNEGYPISTAIIDMDWHLYEYDRKYSSGWTGYTWNKELFPDYKDFIKELKKRKIGVSLNLHPSDGVVAYEEMYPQMAAAMGINPESKEPVNFNFADPKFIENYFDILLHPYEDDGVDFWWIDWQQGITTEIPNADPLWMINHFHSVDMESRGKRPMILSRYAGLGSHRYPLGFSGDTYMNWESLDFQPYFTSCSANVGYGWWSHDIGGHMMGIRDDELMTRWVQLGVFSPIFRLHSSSGELMGKEPWNYSERAEKTAKRYMRIRHKLIPYLYTMNYAAYADNKPIVRPLYHENPSDGAVYDKKYRNEFYFGSELIVSPITKKSESITGMAYTDTYLPKGKWYDIFTGRLYEGGRKYKNYRPLEEMPVFAKAGAIIPLADIDRLENINDTSNPQYLEISVYPQDNGSFEMYEDDGLSLSYKSGDCVRTLFEFEWGDKAEFTINKPVGNIRLIPEKRNYKIRFNNISKCYVESVICGGNDIKYELISDEDSVTVIIGDISEEVSIKLIDIELKKNNPKEDIKKFLLKLNADNDLREIIYREAAGAKSREDLMYFLMSTDIDEKIREVITELICADMGEA